MREWCRNLGAVRIFPLFTDAMQAIKVGMIKIFQLLWLRRINKKPKNQHLVGEVGGVLRTSQGEWDEVLSAVCIEDSVNS